jgi:hypothetical protein
VLEAVPRRRLAVQIAEDGSQPYELARTKSLGYSLFNLEALLTLAAMGRDVGVDLGRVDALPAALSRVLAYEGGPERWPHEQIEPVAPEAFTRLRDLAKRSDLL